jgi:alkylation response protein AidB-like acyl-CoA dehydrogenase
MNFDFTDDQQAIKRTAHEFLEDRFKPEHVRELAESKSYDEDAWKEMCELGWAGIFIPEEHGGQELGTVELIILMEELGYALAPVPFLSSAAAGLALEVAGSDAQKERWLPGLASGELRGTVGHWQNGEARLVPDAEAADVIVLAGPDQGFVVERSAAEVEGFEALDATRRFARVRAEGGDQLPGDPAPALDRICTALAAENVGVAQRAMEMAVDYARERKQFDRPIGSYQAVSHSCAQMLLEVEGSRSAAYYAAWCADAERDSLARAASMAKAYASDAGWRVCTSSLQVHGGIGFTWEHDLHFFLKRAKTNGIMFGSAAEHRERVAQLSGLDGNSHPAQRAEPATSGRLTVAG